MNCINKSLVQGYSPSERALLLSSMIFAHLSYFEPARMDNLPTYGLVTSGALLLGTSIGGALMFVEGLRLCRTNNLEKQL